MGSTTNLEKGETMSSLVLIVEDDQSINRLLSKILERGGISFLFASNLRDAEELFKRNKELVVYIALDGNLKPGISDDPETLILARIIADSSSFHGKVFAMSSIPSHNDILIRMLGDKCETVKSDNIKLDTIKEIVERILKERQVK